MSALDTGVSGMLANQMWMDAVGNNIANSNTVGYKDERAMFTDALYQLLNPASAPSATLGGIDPSALGHGVLVSGLDSNFSQGELQSTGRTTDIAIPPGVDSGMYSRLRGQIRPTELWEILEHRADIPDSAIEAYDRGLASYFEGVWDRALPEFENALATRTGDKAARLMIERCRQFMETQPVDWQGVVELD